MTGRRWNDLGVFCFAAVGVLMAFRKDGVPQWPVAVLFVAGWVALYIARGCDAADPDQPMAGTHA